MVKNDEQEQHDAHEVGEHSQLHVGDHLESSDIKVWFHKKGKISKFFGKFSVSEFVVLSVERSQASRTIFLPKLPPKNLYRSS